MLVKNKIYYLLKGLFLAFIITIISLIIFSLLLKFTGLRESQLPLLNNGVMIISIVVASIYAAIKIKEKGWINGAIVGIVYYAILLLINVLFIKSFDSSFIIISKILISTITGIIGGMIGINLS